jgi:hypothetical protein
LQSGVDDNSGAVVVDFPFVDWGSPCGGSFFVSELPDGTSPAAAPATYTYQRPYTLTQGQIDCGSFVVSYKGDDDILILSNGVTIGACNGNSNGDCFNQGCRTANVPNGILVPGENILEIVVIDSTLVTSGSVTSFTIVPAPARPRPLPQ